MIDAIIKYINQINEFCKLLAPMFIFAGIVYLCGYIRQKLILVKRLNKSLDQVGAELQKSVIEVYKKRMKEEINKTEN